MKLLVGSILALSVYGVTWAGDISWNSSYKDSLAMAKTSNKLVFVDFDANWCPYCDQMKKQTYSDSRVQTELQKYVTVQVVDKEDNAGKDVSDKDTLALQSLNDVTAFPTIVVFEPDGSTLERIEGYHPADELLKDLQGLDDLYVAVQKAKSTVASNPSDGDADAVMSYYYALKSDISDAKDALANAEKANVANKWTNQARMKLGGNYYDDKQYKDAIRILSKATGVGLEPDDQVLCHLYLSLSKYKDGDLAGAKADASTAAGISGASADMIKKAQEIREELNSAG